MDTLDVRREANKTALAVSYRSGVDIKIVRTMERASILKYYRVAVKYEGMVSGMFSAWLNGWRKGYGN